MRPGAGGGRYLMRQRLLAFGNDYYIENAMGQRVYFHVAGGDTLEAQGNILEHEYEIHDGRSRVAEVSKKWFRVADTYGVDIAPDADEILLLACTAIIDMMTAEGR